MARTRILTSVALAAALALSGCGGGGPGQQSVDGLSAAQIYALGEAAFERGDGEEAARLFGEVERLYPYDDIARRALIMQAVSYHRAEDYESARGAADRYITFYPATDDAAYAQYLMALSYYDQIDDVGRDQGVTFLALQELRDVIEMYPDSEYARSAGLKFDLAFDHLAGKEMEVGRYYLKGGHYQAAIGRFRVVVEEFQTTTHTAEALHRLVEAYLSLGLNAEAQTAGAILGYNFRSTVWYQDSYALLTGRGLRPEPVGDDNWLAAIYRQMIRGEWI